jgi:regulatory protein
VRKRGLEGDIAGIVFMKTSDPLRHRSPSMKPGKDPGASAVSYAVKLLSYRDRSEAEIRQRLAQKGFPEEILDTALGRLRDAGLVDDRRFAEALVRHATEVRRIGRRGTRAALHKRGLARELVEEALSRVVEDPSAAAGLIIKRMQGMSGLPAETVRRRLWSLLSRRGFSPETIREALKLSGVKEEG